MSKYINIHNLIGLEIDSTFPWLPDWLYYLTDTAALCDQNGPPVQMNFKVLHDAALSPALMKAMGNEFYIQKSRVFDLLYGTQLEASTNDSLVLKSSKPALEWFLWGTQLVLLRAGAAFVHCAAVEKDGKAILFPSWGGVGKTAIVTEFIRSMSYKLLGDDLAIVHSDGSCFGFPKPMVLYAYHRPLFPEVFGSGRGPVAPVFMNTLLTKAAIQVKPLLRRASPALQFARRYNPQSVRINPSEIFGQQSLSRSAKVEAIIWIDRLPGITAPQFQTDTGSLASRMLGSTLNEIDSRCVNLTNIAMGLGIIDAAQLFIAWLDILQNVSQQTRNAVLYLPSEMPLVEVPGVVINTLRLHEVI